MTTFPLSKPISHGGDEIGSVELRDVRTSDIRRIGNPVSFTMSRSDPDKLEFVVDPEKVFRYVQAMSGLTADAVDLLAPSDYMAMSDHVQEAFISLQAPSQSAKS